ncbi:N-acetylmuramoyl-L-alanine amidase [Kitasatospora sp. NPDC052896]|uniref:N-acetylmuramoyl-L-alanine amidase n=1 Tax=Kitasatospora sp. NPDC052896 TaxID=3364061 RepID=UPI0037C9CEAD
MGALAVPAARARPDDGITARGVPAGARVLQGQFAAAADEFGVPRGLLLALAYQESRWESHQGAPSTTGNYGVLGLTQVDVAAENAARHAAGQGASGGLAGGPRGEDRPHPAHLADPVHVAVSRPRVVDSPALHTLQVAADLIHRPAAQLRVDSEQNIRGGAALLASYQRQSGAVGAGDPARWYAAVARFGQAGATGASGASGAAGAAGRLFADRVYATLRAGVSRWTGEGQWLTLPKVAGLVVPEPFPLVSSSAEVPECPADLGCDFVPAAYALTDPDDPTSYGNYNPAHRPEDGQRIRYLVIHDTESDYAGAIASFQDPHEQATAHYLVRAGDGHVTQLVHTRDIAWHAGNKSINMHSIGIEHEGFAVPTDRPTWYSEQLYESSAALVRYLAGRFAIPLDRQHIIGHDDVPGPTQDAVAGMHWDPGTFWDWAHYLELLRAPLGAGTTAPPRPGDTVTIAPPFDAGNEPPVSEVASRPENFVYLRTRPAPDAPLINNATTAADDWSDKAVTGARYVVADQQGDWTAIWYDGQKCWFANPNGSAARSDGRVTGSPLAAATGVLAGAGVAAGAGVLAGAGEVAPTTVLTPRSGLATIPVYGRAYPEAAAYAPYPAITPLPVVSLRATVSAGQGYLAVDDTPEPADYFYDQNINGDAPNDRTLVVGKDTYYPIRFNHRLAFLKSTDVRAATR